MYNHKRALAVVALLVMLSMWGCSQKPSAVGNSRVRDLEARNAKLEEDYRIAVGQRDLARKKQSAAEEEVAAVTQQMSQQQELVQTASKERDDLKQQAKARTTERDNLHSQLVTLGKELQNLAGRIDSAIASTMPQPVTVAPTPITPRS